MKTKLLLSLLILSWIVAGTLIYLHKDSVRLVKLPPASIAQWYKPEHKRQAWLHNMFKLRREMQAIKHYASTGDEKLLAHWSESFNQHYQKIREMVPEWGGRLDQDAIKSLLDRQQAGEYAQIPLALEAVQESCNACHLQFRAVTASLYRAPDFFNLQVDEADTLKETMQSLNARINTIKIAMQAGDQSRALTTLEGLRSEMDEMGALCESCHTYSPKTYPDDEMLTSLDTLQVQLTLGSLKQQGEALGELAVGACAQCHGTHRIAYDTRVLLETSPGFMELLHH